MEKYYPSNFLFESRDAWFVGFSTFTIHSIRHRSKVLIPVPKEESKYRSPPSLHSPTP